MRPPSRGYGPRWTGTAGGAENTSVVPARLPDVVELAGGCIGFLGVSFTLEHGGLGLHLPHLPIMGRQALPGGLCGLWGPQHGGDRESAARARRRMVLPHLAVVKALVAASLAVHVQKATIVKLGVAVTELVHE